MNPISRIVHKLDFSIKFSNPNRTSYLMPQPKISISKGHKSLPQLQRKIGKQIEKTDVFVSETVESKVGLNTVSQQPKMVKSVKSTGRKPVKDILAKYFDNDKPQNDYLQELKEEELKTAQAVNEYRTVKDAQGIKEFVENISKFQDETPDELYARDLKKYSKKMVESSKNLEQKYAQKTKEYFDDNLKTNNYLQEFAQRENKELAERLEAERRASLIEPYIESFNPRAHKAQKPEYLLDGHSYKDNHNKVQRRNKLLKFY